MPPLLRLLLSTMPALLQSRLAPPLLAAPSWLSRRPRRDTKGVWDMVQNGRKRLKDMEDEVGAARAAAHCALVLPCAPRRHHSAGWALGCLALVLVQALCWALCTAGASPQRVAAGQLPSRLQCAPVFYLRCTDPGDEVGRQHARLVVQAGEAVMHAWCLQLAHSAAITPAGGVAFCGQSWHAAQVATSCP